MKKKTILTKTLIATALTGFVAGSALADTTTAAPTTEATNKAKVAAGTPADTTHDTVTKEGCKGKSKNDCKAAEEGKAKAECGGSNGCNGGEGNSDEGDDE